MSDTQKPASIFDELPMTDAFPLTEDPVVPADEKDTKKKKIHGKKKNYRHVPKANAYIQSSYNNTMVTITDPEGRVLGWSSSGRCGFKGPKKATAYAAGVVVRKVAEYVLPYAVKEVDVFVRGIGSGRDAAIRALNIQGIQVLSISDVTPIPHNGCRPPKVRRI